MSSKVMQLVSLCLVFGAIHWGEQGFRWSTVKKGQLSLAQVNRLREQRVFGYFVVLFN